MSEEARSLRVPSWCPVCQLVMKGSKSTRSYYDFGCCINCQIEFVDGREQRWKDGWRPSPEQLASFVEKIS